MLYIIGPNAPAAIPAAPPDDTGVRIQNFAALMTGLLAGAQLLTMLFGEVKGRR